jgi:hypothetical protein
LFYSEHPTTSIRFDESPLSEYRCAKVDQQCGGILARLQPVYARHKEFSGVMFALIEAHAVDAALPTGYGLETARRSKTVKQLKVKDGPHRLLRHLEIERTHARTSWQEPQCQYLSNDGPFAEPPRTILPAGWRDPS